MSQFGVLNLVLDSPSKHCTIYYCTASCPPGSNPGPPKSDDETKNPEILGHTLPVGSFIAAGLVGGGGGRWLRGRATRHAPRGEASPVAPREAGFAGAGRGCTYGGYGEDVPVRLCSLE